MGNENQIVAPADFVDEKVAGHQAHPALDAMAFHDLAGHIERNPFALGREGRRHQHMFFGSGTFDPIAGLETQIMLDRWGLVGWGQARVPVTRNRYQYRASRIVAAGVGARSGFGLQRGGFLVQQEVFAESPALWESEPALNSGRVSLLATVGTFVTPRPAWQLHALVKVPYYTKAQGGQLRWPFIALVGVTYTFALGQ